MVRWHQTSDAQFAHRGILKKLFTIVHAHARPGMTTADCRIVMHDEQPTRIAYFDFPAHISAMTADAAAD
jgi:hypothetical protein